VPIKYLRYSEIDKSKWDACVINATNTLIYAHSFYLDNCANKQWDAIVLDDYEAVMPLIYRSKFGIKYLFQPAFLQQSGIFFKHEANHELMIPFLDLAMTYFKFAEFNLNYANKRIEKKAVELSLKNNFILNLSYDYESTVANYKSNFIKNIKRAQKQAFIYEPTNEYEKVVDLYKELYQKRTASVKNEDYNALKANCKELLLNNNLIVRQVLLNGKVFAAVILLKDSHRLYNVASCVTEEGKKCRANYFLYDKLIEEFSQSSLVLDFEGSDIPGIADFYKSMGPVNQPYFFLKYNELPKLIKQFKK
jgi:hypothetical protein